MFSRRRNSYLPTVPIVLLLGLIFELFISASAVQLRSDITQATVIISSLPTSAPSFTSLPTDSSTFISRRNAVSVRDVVELTIKIAEEPSPAEDETDEESLTGSGSALSRPSRATIAFIVLIVGLCLLSISYLIYHPPYHLIDERVRPFLSHLADRVPNSVLILSQRIALLYHRIISLIRLPNSPARTSSLLPTTIGAFGKSRRQRRGSLRVGEGRLVQWAQEDMDLLGADEADFMVNAEDLAEAEALDDEYIPLSVGMGWKGKPLPIRNYGSATNW